MSKPALTELAEKMLKLMERKLVSFRADLGKLANQDIAHPGTQKGRSL